MKCIQVSESSVLILFEQTVSPEVFADVKRCASLIDEHLSDKIIDRVVAYASILVEFNLLEITGARLTQTIEQLMREVKPVENLQKSQKVIEIPVYYHPEVGPDLELIANKAGLSVDQVIEVHSSGLYNVYALGFAPGFAYLGDVDERIAHPRKETPRASVHRGSVAVADRQTAIYPATSPGGWQVVGRTPTELINYQREKLTPFDVGDSVRFIPINRAEFLSLGGVL